MKRLSLSMLTLVLLAAGATAALAQQPAAPAAVAPAAPAVAAPVSQIDKGDTAWILTSAALVLLMTAPGLALFYGGMVRQKNALATPSASRLIKRTVAIERVGILTAKPPWSRERALGRPSG